jgi:transcription initiation factor TFIID subunit 5
VGHYFASASHDRTARIWSMDRIQPLRIMAGHLSDVDVSSFCILFICLVVWNLDKTKSFLLLKWKKWVKFFLQVNLPPQIGVFSKDKAIMLSLLYV